MKLSKAYILLFVFIPQLSWSQVSHHSPRYKLDILPTQATHSKVYGINAEGEVAGHVDLSGFGFFQVAKWTFVNGVLTQSLPPANGTTTIYDIQDAAAGGKTVGQSINSSTGFLDAFSWDAQNMPTDLGILPGDRDSNAYAINENSEIVGFSEAYFPQYSIRAVQWSAAGQIILLDNLTTYSIAHDINKYSVAAGFASCAPLCPLGGVHAELFFGGNGQQSLGTLSSSYANSRAYSINNKFFVAGESYNGSLPGNVASRATLWQGRNQIPVDLGLLSGFQGSTAINVNNNGDVVGFAIKPSAYPYYYDMRGVVWKYDASQNNWTMYDLNSVTFNIPTNCVIGYTAKINDNGIIATNLRCNAQPPYVFKAARLIPTN